jgi:transposase
VLEAALWILNTGAQWHILPQCYPNYKTVHRRFQQWCEREVLRELSAQEKDFSPQRAGRAKGQGNESRGVCQQLKGNPHQRDHAPIMP